MIQFVRVAVIAAVVSAATTTHSGTTYDSLLSRNAAHQAVDACLPHGCTNLLSGQCWGDSDRGECYDCYTGPDCSIYKGDECVVETYVNEPVMLQAYWQQRGGQPVTQAPSDWASSYQQTPVLPTLEAKILEFHEFFQNTETEGRRVIVGHGATSVTAAAFYAYTRIAERRGKPFQAFAQVPCYQNFFNFMTFGNVNTQFPNTWNLSWADNAEPTTEGVIEVVNAPSNPRGTWNTPVIQDSSMVICDLVFNWPMLAEPVRKYDCDISFFSLSKIGHAGTRLGWALVKDPEMLDLMFDYMYGTSQGVSTDVQLKGLQLIDYHLQTRGDMFNWARAELGARWAATARIFENCIFEYDGTVVRAVLEQAGVEVGAQNIYVYLEAEDGRSLDAVKVVEEKGFVLGSSGSIYSDTSNAVRFNMLEHPSTWPLMEQRFARMCNFKSR